MINDSTANATTIDGLLKAGQFTPALVSTPSVLNGNLARTINKKTDPPPEAIHSVEANVIYTIGKKH